MPLYNVAEYVVDLVEADSPGDARRDFRERLKAAGFDPYDGDETAPGAFESEQ
jgi:hypothetical protein